MTTNQTIDGVPRKSLEQALKLAAVFDDGGDGADAESARGVVWILRALLDKEVSGDSRAPQPQGEPVAWLAQAIGKGGEVYRNKASTNEPTMRDIEIAWGQGVIDRFTIVIKPLYAEQPAPVVCCSFCDAADQEGNPWSGHSESVDGKLVYRVMGCKDHKHLVDALMGVELEQVTVSPTCCGSCPGGCIYGLKA